MSDSESNLSEELEPDDLDEFDDFDGMDECGAMGGDHSDTRAWQMCQLAGTEHCDWDCEFSRSVMRMIDRNERRRKARRRSHTADLFGSNTGINGAAKPSAVE